MPLQPITTALTRTAVTLVACAVLLLMPIAPSEATTCRDFGGHRICIISVQRSAKNYWEYRATVTVDGDRRPLEVYDCKAKKRITAAGKQIPFEAGGAGELICRLLHR